MLYPSSIIYLDALHQTVQFSTDSKSNHNKIGQSNPNKKFDYEQNELEIKITDSTHCVQCTLYTDLKRKYNFRQQSEMKEDFLLKHETDLYL
jgi:hypothetical protein